MISLEQIKSFFPENAQDEKSCLREYLQYKILEIIFQSKYAVNLCFIGGTALRICYDNLRFSEDLDFDNLGLSVSDFEELSEMVRKGLKIQGIETEIRNVYKGAFHCYIKIPYVLFENNISPLRDEKMLIRMDTAGQGYEFMPSKIMLQKFDVFSLIYTAPLPLIFSQKIFTISDRKRPKGRDFFDLLFLMGRGVKPDYDFLDQKIGVRDGQEVKKYLLTQCEKFDFRKLYLDVKPFLWNQEDRRVEDFVEYVDGYEF